MDGLNDVSTTRIVIMSHSICSKCYLVSNHVSQCSILRKQSNQESSYRQLISLIGALHAFAFGFPFSNPCLFIYRSLSQDITLECFFHLNLLNPLLYGFHNQLPQSSVAKKVTCFLCSYPDFKLSSSVGYD
ncbi:unnamed protein product [Heterobilharzia americana]|nr:unnamed protein product [Heterobilharzia americana]